MGPFVLPALAAGGKLLGLGSAVVGGAMGVDAASKLPAKWKKEAYAAGPDIEGNFSAGFLGNQFIDEESDTFKQGYKDYLIKNSTLLSKGNSLNVDIKFEPGMTQSQVESLNAPAIRKAEALQLATTQKEVDNIINPNKGEMTPLQKREQDRADRQLQMLANQNAQTRADSLTQRADALALERERMEREDHRYNQELMRYNENRRMESISGLAGGLAALAAAFAM